MLLLRKAVGIGLGLPTPKWLLENEAMMIGTEMKFRLKNRNVVHTKLFNSGFKFRYPELKGGLKKVID